MKKRVLVINLGWEQEPLLERLAEKDDFELYGVHYDENFCKKVNWHDVLVCDLRDIPSIITFAERVKPQAVISDQCDYSYFAQAFIAEKFNLPGPRIREAQIGTNKFFQRLLAKDAGFCVPKFTTCRHLKEAKKAASEIGYPIITKPVDNRGSFGVNRVDDPQELDEAFYEALAHSHAREVLVEKYIDGKHLTVDGYIFQRNGPKALAVATKKKLLAKKGIIDGEIIYPGDLPEDIYNFALKNAENIAKYFGFKFGFFHGEFILASDKNIYLTEMSNRGGGIYTSEIILPNFTGIDLLEIYIKDIFGFSSSINGLRLSKKPTILKFLEFLDLGYKGRIHKIEGIEKIKNFPEILSFRFLVHPGDELCPIRNGADRYGFFIGTANNKRDLYNLVKKVESLIRVVIV